MSQPLRIGPYEAEEVVARDAHASVCRVVDPSDGRVLTAKLYAPTGSPDTRVLARWHEEFADEARRLQRHGSDLVPIEASGRAGELAWVVMDMPAGDLLESVLGEPMSSRRAGTMLAAIAAGLDRLHAGGLVHRSLKPSNVLIADGDTPLFLDTLLLGRFPEAVVAGLLPLARVTCVAPEAVLGYRQGAASNQYSLAVMAHRALTGSWPHNAGNAIDYAYACVYQEATAASEALPRVPVQADAVLARAMAKDPEHRYPTCVAFVEELAAALREGLRESGESAREAAEAAAPIEWFEAATTVLELVPESLSEPPPLRVVREPGEQPDLLPQRCAGDEDGADLAEIAPADETIEVADRVEPPRPPTHHRPPARRGLSRLGQKIRDLRGKLPLGPAIGRTPDYLMREEYLAGWREDAARSRGAGDKWSDPITPEWSLTVEAVNPGWLRVDGRYAGPAPAEIAIVGRAGQRVLVELMRDGVAVATKDVQLHPLMDKTWQPQEPRLPQDPF